MRFLHALRRAHIQHGDRVLDYGCGTAALAGWLPEWVVYTGVDTSQKMLERAGREHPGVRLLPWIPEEQFDHTFAIGPFNLKDSWSKDQTWTVLELLWERTEKTMAASLYRGDDPDCIRYELSEAAGWAEACDARRFAVDAAYLDNDFLLVLYR